MTSSTVRRRLRRSVLLLAATLAAALTQTACTSAEKPLGPGRFWQSWSFDPGVVIGLLLTALLYARGIHLNRRGHDFNWKSRWPVICFAAGEVTLALALISPLHAVGEALFSAHMIQHEVLMLIVAPLLVLGRPLGPFLRGLPKDPRQEIHRFARTSFARKLWRFLTAPAIAFVIHGIAIWVWHAPPLFQGAVTNGFIHAAQHLAFLVTAILFWWALLYGHRGRGGYGAAAVYLFLTAVHTSILGAFLTFSPHPWYPIYGLTTGVWNLSPLEDQQLGGLIMWVPGGVVYVVAGLVLFGLWIAESARRLETSPTLSSGFFGRSQS